MSGEIEPGLLRSLLVLGSVVEARDAYTGGHLWRVGTYSRFLAEKIGLDEGGIFLAGIGGFLHDLGKIGVPDEILRKAGPLSEPEYHLIKNHPTIGHRLLKEHPLSYLALDAVTYHHERVDGHGYPSGLTGEMPLMARIVAIADAFDAMTSTRPYRRGMAPEKAVTLLQEGRGSQWDVDLVDAFVALQAAGRFDHVLGHFHHGRRLAHCPKCGPILVLPASLEDGGTVHCRACSASFRMHRRGDGFEAEELGPIVDARLLAPEPEHAAITEFAAPPRRPPSI